MSHADICEYRQFLEKFVSDINVDDQLPVKISAYNIEKDEVNGEIMEWTIQYLTKCIKCPGTLLVAIVRRTIDKMKRDYLTNQSLSYDNGNNYYQPLKLMQTVTKIVIEVCNEILNNFEMESLLLLAANHTATPLPRYTELAIKNKRRTMEDKHVCLSDFHGFFNISNPNERASYFGIFDGHGGETAAFYCASHLHRYLATSKHYPDDPAEAMRTAFLKTDLKFIEKCKKENFNSGSTAVCALYRPYEMKLYVGWVGDSQALLVKKGKLMQIVEPHNCKRTSEVERIKQMKGTVICWYGQLRVDGQLAITRAIGDHNFKPYVTGEPEIACVVLNGEEDFLVLACDGLWDFVSEDDVAVSVYQKIRQDPDNIDQVSEELVKLAKTQGSFDNISVIVVFLKDPALIATDSWPSADIPAPLQSMETAYDDKEINEAFGNASKELFAQSNLNEFNMDYQATAMRNGSREPSPVFLSQCDDGLNVNSYSPKEYSYDNPFANYDAPAIVDNNKISGALMQSTDNGGCEIPGELMNEGDSSAVLTPISEPVASAMDEEDDMGPETDVDGNDEDHLSKEIINKKIEHSERKELNMMTAMVDGVNLMHESSFAEEIQNVKSNPFDCDYLSNNVRELSGELSVECDIVSSATTQETTTTIPSCYTFDEPIEPHKNVLDETKSSELVYADSDMCNDNNSDGNEDEMELSDKTAEPQTDASENSNREQPLEEAAEKQCDDVRNELNESTSHAVSPGIIQNQVLDKVCAADHVGESGEESEDEWNYIKGERTGTEKSSAQIVGQPTETNILQVPQEKLVCDIDALLLDDKQATEIVTNSLCDRNDQICNVIIIQKEENISDPMQSEDLVAAQEQVLTTSALPPLETITDHFGEQDDSELMESQLNPDAKEFVPCSPTRLTPVDTEAAETPHLNNKHLLPTADDIVISQSPRKGISMENIELPTEKEFDLEIYNRPSEAVDEAIRPGSSSSQASYQEMNLKEAMHADEKDHMEYHIFDRTVNDQQTVTDLDIPVASIDKRTEGDDDEHEPKEQEEEDTSTVVAIDVRMMRDDDPMSMSFHQNRMCADDLFAPNPFDLNKVQQIPAFDDDFTEDEQQQQQQLGQCAPMVINGEGGECFVIEDSEFGMTPGSNDKPFVVDDSAAPVDRIVDARMDDATFSELETNSKLDVDEEKPHYVSSNIVRAVQDMTAQVTTMLTEVMTATEETVALTKNTSPFSDGENTPIDTTPMFDLIQSNLEASKTDEAMLIDNSEVHMPQTETTLLTLPVSDELVKPVAEEKLEESVAALGVTLAETPTSDEKNLVTTASVVAAGTINGGIAAAVIPTAKKTTIAGRDKVPDAKSKSAATKSFSAATTVRKAAPGTTTTAASAPKATQRTLAKTASATPAAAAFKATTKQPIAAARPRTAVAAPTSGATSANKMSASGLSSVKKTSSTLTNGIELKSPSSTKRITSMTTTSTGTATALATAASRVVAAPRTATTRPTASAPLKTATTARVPLSKPASARPPLSSSTRTANATTTTTTAAKPLVGARQPLSPTKSRTTTAATTTPDKQTKETTNKQMSSRLSTSATSKVNAASPRTTTTTTQASSNLRKIDVTTIAKSPIGVKRATATTTTTTTSNGIAKTGATTLSKRATGGGFANVRTSAVGIKKTAVTTIGSKGDVKRSGGTTTTTTTAVVKKAMNGGEGMNITEFNTKTITTMLTGGDGSGKNGVVDVNVANQLLNDENALMKGDDNGTPFNNSQIMIIDSATD